MPAGGALTVSVQGFPGAAAPPPRNRRGGHHHLHAPARKHRRTPDSSQQTFEEEDIEESPYPHADYVSSGLDESSFLDESNPPKRDVRSSFLEGGGPLQAAPVKEGVSGLDESSFLEVDSRSSFLEGGGPLQADSRSSFLEGGGPLQADSRSSFLEGGGSLQAADKEGPLVVPPVKEGPLVEAVPPVKEGVRRAVPYPHADYVSGLDESSFLDSLVEADGAVGRSFLEGGGPLQAAPVKEGPLVEAGGAGGGPEQTGPAGGRSTSRLLRVED